MTKHEKIDALIPGPHIFALLDLKPPFESYRQEVVRCAQRRMSVEATAKEMGIRTDQVEGLWRMRR